jgi:hypothetical protein
VGRVFLPEDHNLDWFETSRVVVLTSILLTLVVALT